MYNIELGRFWEAQYGTVTKTLHYPENETPVTESIRGGTLIST